MSNLLKSSSVARLLATLLWLPLLCACSSSDDAAPSTPEDTTSHYINFSVVVSSGNEGTMRVPTDADDDYENGDGREAGFLRENLVEGITLMLYKTDDTKDKKGINTDDNVKIEFIRYYAVEEIRREEEEGKSYGKYKTDEATYTTNDQPLDDSGLDFTATYHVLIVANSNLTGKFNVGSPLKEVRDFCSDSQEQQIYEESSIGGATATKFVMSSESDQTINFNDPLNRRVRGSKTYFTFEGLRVERLAARIDFFAKGATYTTYKESDGYKYDVTGSKDVFVLTAVMPFNLYSGHEFLFKRLTTNELYDDVDYSENNMTYRYLEDEIYTTEIKHRNYVVDPNIGSKTADSERDFMKTDYWLDNIFKKNTEEFNNTLRMPMSDFQSGKEWAKALYKYTEDDETADNIIVCYTKENTLWQTSPLYYYATGLCIEGDYYKEGAETPEHLTYYGFLRHQGETPQDNVDYYPIMTKEELESQKDALQSQFPMNFGVVRNNIYRVSIDNITEKKEITLKIKVKKWDVFTHDVIYM